jgi:plastocyanin/predicted lipoprotein with Yx(FWY)xxD motif
MNGATVSVRSTDEFGDILVGPDGRSLYLFEKDTVGSMASSCNDSCAKAWPPLTESEGPTAGDGVTAPLSTFEREDGSMQVVAAGWPLYFYAADREPGDTNGQEVEGFGAEWYLLAPDGSKIEGHGEDDHSHDHMDEVPTGPADHADVSMKDMDGGHHFDPHVVWVETGGSVTWTLESGAHSTTAYHPDADKPLRIPADARSWNSGVLSNEGATFSHTFEQEGVYDYFCIPHESMGMLGSVIVGHPDPDGQPGLAAPQSGLPEEARSKIEELNEMVKQALTHDSPTHTPSPNSETTGSSY